MRIGLGLFRPGRFLPRFGNFVVLLVRCAWLGADTRSLSSLRFVCRMVRGEKETSTSQACRRRGPARKARSASHIVSSLTTEELRTYCEIPGNIELKLMDKLDESTLGGEHNAVFFYPRITCSRTSFSSARPCQTVFAFYQGASCPCSS